MLRQGGHRSSRLYYAAPINQYMDKDSMMFKIENGQLVETMIPSEAVTSSTVTCSSHVEGYDGFKAFQYSPSEGWRTLGGDIVGAWIQIELPGWIKRPIANQMNNYYDPPVTTHVEVWNASDDKYSIKKFKIQGSLDGTNWDDLRTCNVYSSAPYKEFKYGIPYFQEDETNEEVEYDDDEPAGTSLEDAPRYKFIRLTVLETFQNNDDILTAHAEFSLIRIWGFVDHGDMTWDKYTYTDVRSGQYGEKITTERTVPRFYEKFYMQNDDNDGIIWEKLHQKNSNANEPDAIMTCSLYSYSSTAAGVYPLTIIHPRDPVKPYISNITNRGTKLIQPENFVRAGNFSVIKFSRYRNDLQVVKNEQLFHTPVSGLNTVQHLTFDTSGRGCVIAGNSKNIYVAQIDANGNINYQKVGELDTPSPLAGTEGIGGCMYSDSWVEGSEDEQYYYGYNQNGEKFTYLPKTYQYFYKKAGINPETGEPYPEEIRIGNYEWYKTYTNGQLFSIARQLKWAGYVLNPITSAWDYVEKADLLCVFGATTATLIEDRAIQFRSAGILYFNGEYYLAINFDVGVLSMAYIGSTIDSRTTITEDFFEMPNISVPVIGEYSDHSLGNITVSFNSTALLPNVIRAYDAKTLCNNISGTKVLYFKNGVPCEPCGWFVFTGLAKQKGTSGLYDEALIVMVKGYTEEYQPDPEYHPGIIEHRWVWDVNDSYAWGTNSYMIDRDNATWGDVRR